MDMHSAMHADLGPVSSLLASSTQQAASSAKGTHFLSGHTLSLTPPRGFEAVNAIVVETFKAIKTSGGQVMVSHINASPPDNLLTKKIKNIDIGCTKSEKFEASVQAEYEKITHGLAERHGMLVHVDDQGHLHELNISAEGLVALIRASLKTKDTAAKIFTITEKETRAELLQGEGRDALVLKGRQIAEGGGGKIFLAFDLTRTEKVVVKETDEFESHTRTVLEEERINIKHVVDGLSGAPPIISAPRMVYRFDEAGIKQAGIVLPYYANGDVTSFMQKSGDRLDQAFILLTALRMMDATSILDEKKVLHADIKGGNIFVDSDKKAFLADFDGVLKLDKQSIRKTSEKIADGNYSRSSDAVCSSDDNALQSIAKAVVAKGDEVTRLKKEKAPLKQVKNAEIELQMLEGHLQTMCENVHAFEVAFFSLITLAKISNPRDIKGLIEAPLEKKREVIAQAAATLPEEVRETFKQTMEQALRPINVVDVIPTMKMDRRCTAERLTFSLTPLFGKIIGQPRSLQPIKRKSVRMAPETQSAAAAAKIDSGETSRRSSMISSRPPSPPYSQDADTIKQK